MAAAIEAILNDHKGREGALLPILNEVQATFGHVSEDAIRTIAAALNLTRAEVHGVVSFYHDYRTVPLALPVIKLCRAEACQARGVEQLAGAAERVAAGRVVIEPIYCLGLCSVGPAAMFGRHVFARLDQARLATLIEAAA